MKTLLGGILFAVGILIAGASGLCSLVVFVGALTESNPGATIAMDMFIGGIPFLIGLGLFAVGRAILKSSRSEPFNEMRRPEAPSPDGDER